MARSLLRWAQKGTVQAWREALGGVVAWLVTPAIGPKWGVLRPWGSWLRHRALGRALGRRSGLQVLLHPQAVPQLSWVQRNVLRWHALVGAGGAGGFLLWWALGHWRKQRSAWRLRKLALEQRLRASTTYSEWTNAALALEAHKGKAKDAERSWKRETSLYDRELLRSRLAHLRETRERGDVSEMVFTLRADLLRNLGNMASTKLHEHRLTVPAAIKEYIDEVVLQLEYITNYDLPDFTLEDKLAFLRETRHSFGRTALLLSGGGALGAFHVGVCRTLWEHSVLPRVMAGASAGAIVAAVVCCRTDEELKTLYSDDMEWDLRFFNNTTILKMLKSLILKGVIQDVHYLQRQLRELIGDVTFQEAFDRTGRILNISISPSSSYTEPPRLLNYLSAPHTVVWSAVAASAAFPFLFKPTPLLAKNRRGEFVRFSPESERRWQDGSLRQDLPKKGLSELFNVNYTVVSQINPHVIPLLSLKRLSPTLMSLVNAEIQHRCKLMREILPSWIPGVWLLECYGQEWEGDVTMHLRTNLSNYFELIRRTVTNPNTERMNLTMVEAKGATWPKLATIISNCRIEHTMDECMKSIKQQMQYQHGLRSRELGMGQGRVPSWHDMLYGCTVQPTSPTRSSRSQSYDSLEMQSPEGLGPLELDT